MGDTTETDTAESAPTRASTERLSTAGHVAHRLEQHGRGTASVVVQVLDGVPDWEQLRSEIDRVSRTVLRMRQRVVAALPPLTSARWVTDPDFDLDHHLRRISLPEPGSLRQLLDFAETSHATRLDGDRPLWEATLVEGLRQQGEERSALVWKFSHAVTDRGGRMLFEQIVRAEGSDGDASPMPPLPSPEDLSSIDLTVRELRRLPFTALRDAVRRTTGAAHVVSGAARAPGPVVDRLVNAVSSLRQVSGRATAPTSPLLRRRGLKRRVEVLDVDFAELRGVAAASGFSLHDAYVAAVCGGLRLYHESLGVPVEAVPLAMSISIEADGDPAANAWFGMRLMAPVAETDPVTRMRKVRETVLTAKDGPGEDILRAAAPVVAWLPDPLLSAIGDAIPGVDVNVGNLGGRIDPAYIAGIRVAQIVPIGPLFGAAMTILVYSADGRGHVGVHMDTDAVTDPALFQDCLRQGFDELIRFRQQPSSAKTST